MPKLNWKPVRRGEIYCSTACGGGCLYAEYKAAVKAAEDCRKRMKNPEAWRIRVHENLGWYWSLVHVKGHMDVSGGQSPTNGFHAMLSMKGIAGACDAELYDDLRHRTPQGAVEHRMRFARAHAEKLNSLITQVTGEIE